MNYFAQSLVHSKPGVVPVIVNNKARTPLLGPKPPWAEKCAPEPFCSVGPEEEAQLSRELREQITGRCLVWASPSWAWD